PFVVATLAERIMMGGNEFTGVYVYYKSQFSGLLKGLLSSPFESTAAMLERTFKISCYLGLFCLPLLPGAIKQIWTDLRARRWFAPAAVAIAALISAQSYVHIVCQNRQLMPFSQNLLRIPMVGPLDLMGICVEAIKPRHRLWLTIAGSVLAIII